MLGWSRRDQCVSIISVILSKHEKPFFGWAELLGGSRRSGAVHDHRNDKDRSVTQKTAKLCFTVGSSRHRQHTIDFTELE